MGILYNVLLTLGIVIAVFFTLLILFTGKGDAMSGGGSSVRTTFKGKASFDDYLSRLTLGLGIGFIALMILLNYIGSR